MTRYEVSGTDFRALAAKLRVAEHDLPAQARRAVTKAARPLPAAAKRSALANLPRRRGLNVLVARARITVRRVSPTTLDIRARGLEQLGNTNAGEISHPTFGHAPRVVQQIPKARDWFFKPMRKRKNEIADELGDAMHRVAKRIT